jgi:hypothetical protein
MNSSLSPVYSHRSRLKLKSKRLGGGAASSGPRHFVGWESEPALPPAEKCFVKPVTNLLGARHFVQRSHLSKWGWICKATS